MERIDGRHVGERLRAIRRQKGLSLHDVEARSDQEFKARCSAPTSGASGRISVPRLLRLAELYRVPPDQLLPAGDADVEIDLTEPVGLVGDGFTIDLVRLHEIDDADAAVIARYAATIQLQRQDFNGQMLTIRRDDLRVLAAVLGRSPEDLGSRLDELGLRAVAASDARRARSTAPVSSGPRLRSSPTCQHRRRPRSRSSYRATTSWWACSVSATSCCASSRTRSPSTIHVRGQRDHRPRRRGRGGPRRPAVRGAGRCCSKPGHVLDREGVGRTHRDDEGRPATDRGAHHRGAARAQAGAAEDRGPEALRRRGARAHGHVRHRPGGHRQELPRGRARGAGAAGEGDQPHHPHPPRGRGGRAARLPPRRHPRQGRPVPAPALRRAVRHARARGRSAG